ncbi:MAG: sugar phosphate isomerase/epimerase [Actinomycetota bacterium]
MHTATESSFLRRVATAPISWGVCEVPGWGHQLAPDRVLAEMHELGFGATELGSAGWLPERTDELQPLLAEHDLELLAAFIPLVLHDPAQADTARAEAVEAARLLRDNGARYFNTAPVTSADWAPRRPYRDAEWDHLVAMIAEVEEICAEHGLVQVVHEHVGCVIETADEIDRLLSMSPVSFVLDTGHMAVGGCDPLRFAIDHADRVGLVHLKDTRHGVAARLNAGELTLMEAVQAGLFPALGEGDLPIDDIVRQLETAGFTGHYVIEQDCAITDGPPGPGEGPVRDVAISVAYLRRVDAALRGTDASDPASASHR